MPTCFIHRRCFRFSLRTPFCGCRFRVETFRPNFAKESGPTSFLSYGRKPSRCSEALKATGTASPFEWENCRTYLWDRFGTILERAGLPNDGKSEVSSHPQNRGFDV